MAEKKYVFDEAYMPQSESEYYIRVSGETRQSGGIVWFEVGNALDNDGWWLLDYTPGQARALARLLNEAADAAEGRE
jgi:hypothetical protein